MHRPARTILLAILVCFWGGAAAVAQSSAGALRGTVTDSSGGALPGVTVVATSLDGRVLATTPTDNGGAYDLAGLPIGELRLTFQLDGFVAASVPAVVAPGPASVTAQRLELAPVTETVVVVGQATILSPPSSPVAAARAAATPVAAHDRESICGPAKPPPLPESFGTIRSGRLDAGRHLYTQDDELVIEGGRADGLRPGLNLAVRRRFRTTDAAGMLMFGEHTAGLIQIVDAEERVSRAVVVYACDELMKGDFLASFKPEPIRTPDPAGTPAYAEAARILFGDAGQMLGAPGRLLVIDRGSDHGLHVGQRVTLFRRRRQKGATPSVVGDAVVVAIRGDSATIRVDGVTDVVSAGDWAAPHRRSQAATSNGSGAGSR